MANRYVLHHKHLESFTSWLSQNGWVIVPTRGEYEVLRAIKHRRKYPLIIYTRLDAKEHYSVMDRDMPVIKKFLREVM